MIWMAWIQTSHANYFVFMYADNKETRRPLPKCKSYFDSSDTGQLRDMCGQRKRKLWEIVISINFHSISSWIGFDSIFPMQIPLTQSPIGRYSTSLSSHFNVANSKARRKYQVFSRLVLFQIKSYFLLLNGKMLQKNMKENMIMCIDPIQAEESCNWNSWLQTSIHIRSNIVVQCIYIQNDDNWHELNSIKFIQNLFIIGAAHLNQQKQWTTCNLMPSQLLVMIKIIYMYACVGWRRRKKNHFYR